MTVRLLLTGIAADGGAVGDVVTRREQVDDAARVGLHVVQLGVRGDRVAVRALQDGRAGARPPRLRIGVEVAAEREHAGRLGRLHLAERQLDRLRQVVVLVGDPVVGESLEGEPVRRVHQVPAAVELERAGPGVELVGAVGEHEEGASLNPEVGVDPGRLHASLGEDAVDGAEPGTGPHLRGVGAAQRSHRGGRPLEHLGHRLLERDPGCFVRDGVDVGHVVTDHVHPDHVVGQSGNT